MNVISHKWRVPCIYQTAIKSPFSCITKYKKPRCDWCECGDQKNLNFNAIEGVKWEFENFKITRIRPAYVYTASRLTDSDVLGLLSPLFAGFLCGQHELLCFWHDCRLISMCHIGQFGARCYRSVDLSTLSLYFACMYMDSQPLAITSSSLVQLLSTYLILRETAQHTSALTLVSSVFDNG